MIKCHLAALLRNFQNGGVERNSGEHIDAFFFTRLWRRMGAKDSNLIFTVFLPFNVNLYYLAIIPQNIIYFTTTNITMCWTLLLQGPLVTPLSEHLGSTLAIFGESSVRPRSYREGDTILVLWESSRPAHEVIRTWFWLTTPGPAKMELDMKINTLI